MKRNISAFGRSPNKVTIAGEWAGGISICAQLASPAASGLFKGAINESGPCLPQPTMARAEERAGELVTKLDVAAMARAQGAEAIGPIASFSELDAALMIAVDSVCSGRVFVIDGVVENA